MRVVFAGTPPFAACALEALASAGHALPLVLTQPDRPAGRGMRLAASAVSATAERLGLATFKPPALRDANAVQALRDIEPDVMVVAAYGLILPREVLAVPRLGCVNIHASLLPRWRGAAPIQRALLAGDATTGITLMRMDAGLDTGPVISRHELAIGPRDTTGTLTEALAKLGARAIVEVLPRLADLEPQPQDETRAIYAPKVAKAEARIDWTRPAVEIDRLIRAFNPTPGAEARLGEEVLKIWDARPTAGHGAPGAVLETQDGRLVVGCGAGALELHTIQRPGGKRVPAADFLRGARLTPGNQR